jgi:hypothetical protein
MVRSRTTIQGRRFPHIGQSKKAPKGLNCRHEKTLRRGLEGYRFVSIRKIRAIVAYIIQAP